VSYFTVKVIPEDLPPAVVTLTSLVPAPVAGTLHTIWVLDQETYRVTSVLPKVTVEVPRLVPKPVPVIVTCVPGEPDRGASLLIRGTTLKGIRLERPAAVVTDRFTAPEAPAGTLGIRPGYIADDLITPEGDIG
jgi:hypothetical protein